MPRCMPDGTFDEVQCCPSGYCWCSNSSGSVYGVSRGWPSCVTGGWLNVLCRLVYLAILSSVFLRH